MIKLTETFTTKGRYNLIVAGGGVAGVAAALSARRQGLSVLLVEKCVKLGGLATTGLINLFEPMCNGRGKQIVFGMADEFLQLAIRYGYDTLSDEWKNGEPGLTDDESIPRYKTRFSPEIFALTLTEILHNEKVDLLFDTVVSFPYMKGTNCAGLVLENKSGRQFYEGDIVLDATGDADVLFRAGVPTVQGKNYFTYYGQEITLDLCKKAVGSGQINHAIRMIYGGRANLFGKNHPDEIPLFTGTSAEDVNRYIISNQLLMLQKIKKQDRFSREIVTLPGMAQFRTTRHIDGEYTLQENDAFRHFEDSIAAISDFSRRNILYEIPYRCLVKKGFDNLLTAGRTVSACGYAWDVVRVIPPAIITGQAAGIAAAIAIKNSTPVFDICISELQSILESNNVQVHFDDRLIPSKRNQ